MSERTDADKLAERIVDRDFLVGPDDVKMLARQLLRRREVIDRLENRLMEMSDNTLDLINANRDSILRIHEDGVRRIGKVLRKTRTERGIEALGACDVQLVCRILDAINSFHPMHGESWSGWPEGT